MRVPSSALAIAEASVMTTSFTPALMASNEFSSLGIMPP